jgi:type III pantothenate kinase
MLLCLDIGNSQIYGGVFDKHDIRLRFRYDSQQASTSDQLGIFLRTVLRENNINPNKVKDIAVASVVPNLDYSVRAACRKYFDCDPFVLTSSTKTGLTIQYANPEQVGADRIATAIAGAHHFNEQPVIIVDLGTATTFDVINANKTYLGGVILAGIRLSMEALQSNTAKLSAVEIISPSRVVGKSTKEGIQSGLFYGQVGMIRELTTRISREVFENAKPIIIGTGGFAYLFEHEQLFDAIMPDLVLDGLRLAYGLNRE